MVCELVRCCQFNHCANGGSDAVINLLKEFCTIEHKKYKYKENVFRNYPELLTYILNDDESRIREVYAAWNMVGDRVFGG